MITIKSVAKNLLVRFFTRTPVLSKIFRLCLKVIANEEIDSNKLLKDGVVVYPIHFYYPAPDFEDLERRGAYGKKNNLARIDFNENGNWNF